MSAARRQTAERTERLLGPQREVTITDARAIRALAHDARQRVIEVLYGEQRPRTATELARLTGLSPSAMSYHLRALEKWGVVERSTDEGDARNRPWRAGGTSLRIDTSHLGPATERPDGRSAPRWPPSTAARAPPAATRGPGRIDGARRRRAVADAGPGRAAVAVAGERDPGRARSRLAQRAGARPRTDGLPRSILPGPAAGGRSGPRSATRTRFLASGRPDGTGGSRLWCRRLGRVGGCRRQSPPGAEWAASLRPRSGDSA